MDGYFDQGAHHLKDVYKRQVVFCLFVVVLAVLQQKLTQSKEVQQ